ncbi:hypothetical protein DCAR_0729511 [Daucus carota subsp. sativus]|uniref:Uncharacterized protein n=1 Tax=Daucus carota subsp. sativus TaxID=79200 RepID=A0A164U9U9_DAUCS|nr:hypothetical protein DCAR_0729511 [Daucus carota subsp. sativus]
MPKPEDNSQHGENNVDGKDDNSNNATPETNDQGSLMPKPEATGQHGVNNVDGKDDAERTGSGIVSADVIIIKEDCDTDDFKKNTKASKRKTPNRCEPMPDSIGARLRARRRICSQ